MSGRHDAYSRGFQDALEKYAAGIFGGGARGESEASPYDYIVPAAAVAGSATAGKFGYDVHRLQGAMRAAEKAVGDFGSSLPSGAFYDSDLGHNVAMPVAMADKALDTYNSNMLNVSRSKLMGIGAGSVFRDTLMAKEFGEHALDKIRKSNYEPSMVVEGLVDAYRNSDASRKHPASYLHHMVAFTDPLANVHTLRGHAIAQAITPHLLAKSMPKDVNLRDWLIDGHANGDLDARLKKIMDGPTTYGFLGKDHAARTIDTLQYLTGKEGKPIADIMNFLSGQRALPEPLISYLTGGSTDSLETRLAYIKSHAPALGVNDPEYIDSLTKTIKKGLLGGPDWMTDKSHVGKALRMVGNGANVLGQAKGYSTGAVRALTPVKLTALALSGAAGAYGIAELAGLINKKKELIKASAADERQTGAVESALPFLGATPLAAYGLANMSTPRDIALTYGVMDKKFGGPEITGGHRNPAKALKELLSNKDIAPWYSSFFNIGDDVVRGPGGILNEHTVRPNILLDTGFGALFRADSADKHVPMFAPELESVRPLSVMSYQTDLASSHGRHAGATASVDPAVYGKVRRDILGYGDNIENFFNEAKRINPAGMRNTHMAYLGNSFGPALLQSALSNASSKVDKASTLERIAKTYDGKDPDFAAKVRELADKKLFVISGSTRGDYVAQRAKDISDAIQRAGAKNIAVVGQFGDALSDPLTDRILNGADVLKFGKMDNDLYTALQSMADVHSASSGANAIAEASAMKSPITMPEDWGKWNGLAPDASTIAGKTYHSAVNLELETLAKAHGLPLDSDIVDLAGHAMRRPSRGVGNMFDLTGRIVSGDVNGLLPEEAASLTSVRSKIAPENLKGFANKLSEIFMYGDPRGWQYNDNRLAPIADWNEGAVQRVLNMKGTAKWDPDSLVKLMTDDNQLAALKSEAQERAASELGAIQNARKNLSREVYSRALKNYVVHKGKTLGALAGAGALTAYGVNKLYNKPVGVEMPAADNNPYSGWGKHAMSKQAFGLDGMPSSGDVLSKALPDHPAWQIAGGLAPYAALSLMAGRGGKTGTVGKIGLGAVGAWDSLVSGGKAVDAVGKGNYGEAAGHALSTLGTAAMGGAGLVAAPRRLLGVGAHTEAEAATRSFGKGMLQKIPGGVAVGKGARNVIDEVGHGRGIFTGMNAPAMYAMGAGGAYADARADNRLVRDEYRRRWESTRDSYLPKPDRVMNGSYM